MSAPILLIEDNPNDATLTIRQLQRASIRNPVAHFASGGEGLAYLEQAQPMPVLVMLDLGIPDIHGLDILKYIRKHDREDIQRLCVFILTVHDDQETIARTIKTGANEFLSKNLNIGKFLAAAQDCGVRLDIG